MKDYNMTEQRRLLGIACEVLLIVGAFNWGSVGLFNFNFVHSILSGFPSIEKGIYTLVGLAGAYIFYRLVAAEYISKNPVNF